jgi:hypothetical protein
MIEVIKQLVDALEWCYGGEPVNTADAIKAGKKLIAELESQNIKQITVKDFIHIVEGKEDLIGRPVYFAQWPNGNAHPPQRTWVGLTDDEIEERQEEFEEIEDMPFSQNDWLWFYTRAIEAKLKEKNNA